MIVQGANLLRVQLAIACTSAGICFALMVPLVPSLGISGAGISLLIAEFVALIGYVYSASLVLQSTGLKWPWQSFNTVVTSTLIVTLGLMISGGFESARWTILSGLMVATCLSSIVYWRTLPDFTRQRAIGVYTTFQFAIFNRFN